MSRNTTTRYRYQEAMPQRVRDVLGRLKVTMHQNIYDADFEYGPQSLRWETLVQNVSGNTNIQTIPSSGGVRMRVGQSAGDINIRQSRPYHRYQPGKTMFMATGATLGTALPGNVQRIGFFDDANGIFFEQGVATAANPFGMYVVVRTDVGGTIQETRVGLDNWNGDRDLIGSLDFNKIQMFWMEYGWYGAGATRFGFWLDGEPFIAHQIGWGNYANQLTSGAQTTPWSRTGNLPVRYEQRNTAGTSAVNDMYHYGVSVIIEGQSDDQRGFTYSYGLPNTLQTRSVAPSTTRFPLLTIRGRNMGTQEYGNAYASVGSNSTITITVMSSSTFVVSPMTTNTNYIMTVTAVTTGTITVGQVLSGTGFPWGTHIVGQLTSTGPVSTSTTATSLVLAGTSTVAISTATGIAVGMLVSGTGIAAGTFVGTATQNLQLVDKFGLSTVTTANITTGTVLSFRTTGGTGTYRISTAPTLVGITTATTNAGGIFTLTNVLVSTTVTGFAQQFTVPAANWTVNQYQGRQIYFPSLASTQVGVSGKIIAHSTNTLYCADIATGLTLTALPAVGTLATTAISGGGAGQFAFTVASNIGITTGTAVVGVGISTGSVVTHVAGTSVTVNLPMTAGASGNGIFNQGYCIGLLNRGQLLPKRLMISSDNRCVVEIISGSIVTPVTFTGQQPNYTPLASIGSNYSFAERDYISTSTVTSSGEVVFAFTLAAGSGLQDIDLGYFFPLYNSIRGNQIDTLTLAITTVAGTTAVVGGHMICQEAMS
jgi:hypothetical protein